MGEEGALLNLGTIWANGLKYATSITLTLQDASGREFQGFLNPPGVVGGRLDPYILPLAKGEAVKLQLNLAKYTLYAGRCSPRFMMYCQIADPPQAATTKQYTVQAQFTGRGVRQAKATIGMNRMARMPEYWTGTVTSNSVNSLPK